MKRHQKGERKREMNRNERASVYDKLIAPPVIKGVVVPVKDPGKRWELHTPTAEEEALGDSAAYYMGDTFIEFEEMSPTEQWTRILTILRTHHVNVSFSNNILDDTVAVEEPLEIPCKEAFDTCLTPQPVTVEISPAPCSKSSKGKFVITCLFLFTLGIAVGYVLGTMLP